MLILSLLLGACAAGTAPDPPAGPDAIVGERGFAVSIDGVTVMGPAGVAPPGTGVHIKPAAGLVPQGLAGVESGSAFDISLDGGAQPQVPVTVSFTLPQEARDHSALFFVTKRSDTGRWEGLPVTVTEGRATVTLTHFSFGWFGWADQVRDWFIDQVKQFLKVGFPKPDCVGKPANVRGREYQVSADNDGLYACMSSGADSPTTTIHSATPFVWRFRPTPGEGVGQQGVAPLELSGIATLALFDAMKNFTYDDETVLVPGGSASIKLKSGVTDTRTGARVDAGLGLVAVLVAGLDMAAAMASGQTPKTWLEAALGKAENANKIRQAAECMAGLFEGSQDVGGRLGQVGNTVLSCTGNLMGELTQGFASGVVGVVVGIVTSLAGLLVTQVWGLIGEFTGQNEVAMHITSKASAVVLSANGIDSFRFGAKESEVLAYLTPILGKPRIQEDGGGCEAAGLGYQSYARFGDLEVRFAANDKEATSPRSLASWNVELASRQQGGLALASSIPFGLSLDQLRSKYPNGGGLEHMQAWFAGGVWIIPGDSGAKTILHAGELDWCI